MGAARCWPGFGAPETLGVRISTLAVFPSPERADRSRWIINVPRGWPGFGAPETLGLRMLALAIFPSPREGLQWPFESYPHHVVGLVSVLRRRLASGCRFWRYFRAPERAYSSRLNHQPSTWLAWFRSSWGARGPLGGLLGSTLGCLNRLLPASRV